MARATLFSTWLNRTLDRQPNIDGPQLKRKWENEHPGEEFPPHAYSALSQSKRRRRERLQDDSEDDDALAEPSWNNGREQEIDADDSSATLDRLEEIVSEYRRIKEENELLKRRLNEIVGQVE